MHCEVHIFFHWWELIHFSTMALSQIDSHKKPQDTKCCSVHVCPSWYGDLWVVATLFKIWSFFPFFLRALLFSQHFKPECERCVPSKSHLKFLGVYIQWCHFELCLLAATVRALLTTYGGGDYFRHFLLTDPRQTVAKPYDECVAIYKRGWKWNFGPYTSVFLKSKSCFLR